jgi:hypothetical protein
MIRLARRATAARKVSSMPSAMGRQQPAGGLEVPQTGLSEFLR